MKKTWKGKPVLTTEDMAKMDCPYPPEPQWADKFEEMEEVYTCFCKNQSWTIYGVKIECTKCGKKYLIGTGNLCDLEAPAFNANRETLEVK